ncbi:MAG: hypothetical protein ACLFP1_03705 [Candidatus Goldiibacteriota bacterium]
MKKRAAVIAALITVFAFCTAAAEQEQAGSGQEIIVKGQLKIKIDTEKPEIGIETDINEVADKAIKTEEKFLSLSPADVKDIKFGLPGEMNQQRAAYDAQYDFFETGPVFSLKPRIEGIEIEKWVFSVTDIAGQTAYGKEGKGRLPDKFVWDGFDRDGNMMKLGSGYTYQLAFMTKSGVPETLRRNKPKEVHAVRYRRDGKLVLEVSNEKIFRESREERISEEGGKILEEVMDYIKMSNRYPVLIQVFSEDKGLAQDQIRTLKKRLLRHLKIPEKDLEFKGYKDTQVPKNERVVVKIKG